MIWGVILFQGIIFAVLIFVLRHFMQGHVSGAVGHLEKLNEELLKQQAELKEKISEAEKEYESKMAKVQQEVTARQSQVRQEANKTLEDARTRGQEEREKLIKEAIDTRDKIKNEIMVQMEEKAVDYSREVIAQFLSGEIRKFVHETLVKEVIDGIKDMPIEHFQIDSPTAEFLSAEPLNEALKKQIYSVLKDKIKQEVQFKEEVDPALVGGIILKFGSFVIDGSLANRLKEATSKIKVETKRKYLGKT